MIQIKDVVVLGANGTMGAGSGVRTDLTSSWIRWRRSIFRLRFF